MTQLLDDAAEADRVLKARHRTMWALGDYPAVASQVIPDLGPALVAAAAVTAQDRVLDVGAGSGNAAIPAARTGATVIASDLTPELLEVGRQEAAEAGVHLGWRAADAEALPFANAEFDVVLSCVGVMFAPHHEAAAGELVRVCRPGGRIALLSWTPAGFVGRLFTTMKPYAPAPPPGAQAPPLWGDEQHVRGLLGDHVTDVVAVTASLRVDRFSDAEEFRDFFRESYGPTIAVYRSLNGDPVRTAALDRDLVELARSFGVDTGVMHWEYLLLTAVRAG